MSPDRERVRALVRRELKSRLGPVRPDAAGVAVVVHAALAEIYVGPQCSEDPDFPERRPCVIEPDRFCTNSGYCKKLGY